MQRSDCFVLSSEMRWNISQADERLVEQLQAELGLSGLMAKLMAARGWTAREAKQMLHINKEAFHDPFAMDDMAAAVRRIETAVEQQEYIRIYGDYDCDGVSSTTIMYKGLLEYGARVDYYIPDRFREGYGLNNAALEKAKEDGVNLLITVDTGISGRDEVDYGQKIGLDIIVTDHHEPPPELPECTAVINPKKPGCTCSTTEPGRNSCMRSVAAGSGSSGRKRMPPRKDAAASRTIGGPTAA
jgi:single-stranded-DNA-specific exonuclease